jgi:aerobic-type carbon monoxide dehydrogenase small subunit (CoxS/CutS family)
VNRTITCTINGNKKELNVDVRQSLLEVLREQLGLISIKQGCAVGECGACTVLIDDVPMDACIYLAVWADGRAIRTVEGESQDGQLSVIQQAFVDEGAVQCGICTPGFVMAATALVEKNKGRKVSRDEIRRQLAGNLCRCTGYDTIVTAVEKSLGNAEGGMRNVEGKNK